MKKIVRLPLFVNITQIPKCGELRGKWLKWLDVREGHTFRHLPGNKGDEDQELAKVKLIALILRFVLV
jgi:hypothetical protein